MDIFRKSKPPLVGVDLDARSVAAVQLAPDGRPARVGVAPMAPGSFEKGEVIDVDGVASSLRELFSRSGLSNRVRISIANQRVAFRTVRLPVIDDPQQLKAAVRFQAQEQIPMPLESAVLDHQVIGGAVSEEGNRQIDVAVVAARVESVSALLEAARRAGLDPEGVDLSSFGMIRALAPHNGFAGANGGDGGGDGEEFVPAILYANLGDQPNLAIARDRACLFSRVAEFGVREVAEGLAAETGMPSEHAEQWLVHTGFATPLDQISGDAGAAAKARAALERGLARIVDELRISLDYYGSQDGAAPVGDVVLCGWGSSIPGIAEAISGELGRGVSARRPGALAGLADVEASRLTLPSGIALES
jgi:type IV pilus assembly protein PilM